MTEHTTSKRPLTGPAKLGIALAAGTAILLPFLLQLRVGHEPQSTKTPAAQNSAAVNSEPQQKELAMLEQHLSSKPDHTPMLIRLAQLERERANPAKAAEYLRRAIEVEPDNEEAQLELGRALYESGDVNAALEETKKLVDRSPKNVDALYNLGAIYGNQGNYAEARRLFEQAVAAGPTSQSGTLARQALAKIPPVTAAR